jgi:hypothetical protein
MPKVKIGEETHEVELSAIAFDEGYRVLGPDEIPDGFVTKDSMNQTVTDRLNRQKRALKTDSEFVREVLESAGVPLDDDGKVKIPKSQDVDEDAIRERIKTTIIREQVDPLKQQAESLAAEVQTLRMEKRDGGILEMARRAGVQDYLFDPPTDGAPAPIVNLIAPYLAYHDERKDWYIKDGDGYAPSAKEGKPYADVSDLFDRLKKNEAWKHIFVDKRPGSSGLNNSKSGTNGAPSGRKRSEMSTQEAAKFIEEHGSEAYLALPIK